MKPKKPKVPAEQEVELPLLRIKLPPGSRLELPGTLAFAEMLQQLLLQYQREFEAGDPLAWLRAVDACVIHGWPIPPWARLKFFNGVSAWLSYQAATLDKAWGLRRPRKQLGAGEWRDGYDPSSWPGSSSFTIMKVDRSP